MFAALINGMRWAEMTAVHDGDAVAYSEEFGQVTAYEENGFALCCELVNQVVDVGFAGNVNAARGFVQKQAIYVVVEQAGERDFLLVAAGEVRNGLCRSRCANAEARYPLAGNGSQFFRRDDPSGQAREGEVIGQAHRLGEALVFAVFAEQSHALRETLCRCCSGCVVREGDIAFADGGKAKDGAQKFRAARADEAANAEYFSAVQNEGRAVRERVGSEVREVEERLARCAIGAGEKVVDLSAYHEVDDVGYGRLGDRATAGFFAVSEDCELIGDFCDFFEEVRDIDDCQIPRFQALHHAK